MLSIVVGLAGGLAILLLGLQLLSDGLKAASRKGLRTAFNRVTASRLRAFLVGGLLTVFLQSSMVVTVILVGLAGAGVIVFGQTLPVILGANVGATLTVQLIVFNLAEYSLLAVLVGFILRQRASGRKARHIGDAIMGFGLLFFGMHVMAWAAAPLQHHEGTARWLLALGTSPFLTLLAGVVFTALVRSSAAAIGFLLTLAGQGLVDLSMAIPFLLGANIGTCFSAVLASLGASVAAKRVAASHVLFKVAGVALLWPFLGPFERLVMESASGLSRQIAHAHTLFNVGLAVVFLPFTDYAARLIERLLPDSPAEKRLDTPLFLDREAAATAPPLALDQAERETLRVAEIVHDMVASLGPMVVNNDEELLAATLEKEVAVDNLFKAISAHLTEISESELDRDSAEQVIRLLYVLNDLEHAGDLVANAAYGGMKKIQRGLSFSPQGLHEILSLHRGVTALFRDAIQAFAENNPVRARAVLTSLPYLLELEQRSRLAHMGRLQAGLQVSRETSGIHLDIINALARIAGHAGSIAQAVLRPELWSVASEANAPAAGAEAAR